MVYHNIAGQIIEADGLKGELGVNRAVRIVVGLRGWEAVCKH